MNAEKDLTKGPLWKQIILFSLPLMFSNILQALFNMSDIAVVGKFAGNTALGAVGSTTILVSLFTGFLIGLGNGVNVVVARFIGEKNHKKIIRNEQDFKIQLDLYILFLIIIPATPTAATTPIA